MAKRRIEKKLEYGERGEAVLTKLDKSRARLEFASGKTCFLNNVVQGNPFEDEEANLPQYVPFGPMVVNKSIKVNATMNQDGTKAMFVVPSSGEYHVRFVEFASTEDVPCWTEKIGKGKRPYQYAFPILEITDGHWKGCRVRGVIYNNFGLDPDDNCLTIMGSGKGSDNLEDFCVSVGFEYWTVPYTENPLPLIQECALEKSEVFSIILVGGGIENYIPNLDDDAFEEPGSSLQNKVEEMLNE